MSVADSHPVATKLLWVEVIMLTVVGLAGAVLMFLSASDQGLAATLRPASICLSPAGALGVTVLIWSRRRRQSGALLFLGHIVAYALALFAAIALVAVAAVSAAITPTQVGGAKAIREYKELREGYAESGLVDHFPVNVPDDARSIELFHLPKFLQGGMEFQVRVELPADQVQAILDEYRPQGLGEFVPETGVSFLGDGDPRTLPNWLDQDTNAWPASHEMIVLRGNAAGKPGHIWNHGDCAGLAVDVERNLVVWWARYW